jgi:hypothetical protein
MRSPTRRVSAAGCPHCLPSLEDDYPEHSPDYALIKAYRQLAADLASAGGER